MHNDQHTDEALILAYKAGDKQALNTLVRRWHRPFCDKAYWMTRDKNAAKDIAQDSWTTIIDRIEVLKDPAKFKFWAYRIVCNKSTDWLRLRSKQVRFPEHYDQQVNDDIKDEPRDKLVKQTLLSAIGKLPDNQRIIVRLFYLESYSLIQISELLGISVGTAKSRLFHAREKLKKTLKHYNYEN